MSTSWDPYGPSGGSVPSANSSGPISHLQHHLMTSSTGVASSSAPSSSSYSGAGGAGIGNNMPRGTSIPPQGSVQHQRGLPLPVISHPFSPGRYAPPHIASHSHGGPPPPHHGSHVLPPYSGTPVIHPYPPPHSNHQPSYHHVLAPVLPLPGTAPLFPPLGVPAYTPPPHHHYYGQPTHHVPFTNHNQPMPLTPQQQQQQHHQHHAPSHVAPLTLPPQPQPCNLKVTAGASPQPISAPMMPGPGSVPQTTLGPPTQSPFVNGPPGGPAYDLSPELLSAGWEKNWSKRENSWYFFNRFTRESIWDWELPQLLAKYPPQHSRAYNPLTDPLGISCANGPGGANHLERRASSGEQLGSPVVKIVAGPWDLEVSSNVHSSEAAVQNSHLLPPHPDIEIERAKLLAKLRQCYQQSCRSRGGIDAPKDSLNRWIMERKIYDLRGTDPVFPSCDIAEGIVSQVMFKEIMNDLSMKVVKPRYAGDARVHLRQTCQPHVHTAVKSSVEGICKKMSLLVSQYGQNVKEAHLKHFVDPQLPKQSHEPDEGRFPCHPALCGGYVFSDTGKLPQIEYIAQDNVVLKYTNDIVRISALVFRKLEQLYRYNCMDDRKFEFFLARVFCLLKRYNSFCEDYASASGTQSSLPVTVGSEAIQRNFGVTFECFASPLNCYFQQFCSAFPDIDGYFGSRGTFLDYKPVSGSFQMNPPYAEELMDAACITHAEDLLAGTKEPMSFIVFVPEGSEEKDYGSSDPSEIKCQWIKRLANSRWNRKQVTISAFEHEFRHAMQHLLLIREVSVRSTHNTVVFWLQNDAGFEEWKPTEEKVDALTDAYRPGRERERDRQELLAPERQNPH